MLRVVNGYSHTSGRPDDSACTSDDLPTFGAPTSATWQRAPRPLRGGGRDRRVRPVGNSLLRASGALLRDAGSGDALSSAAWQAMGASAVGWIDSQSAGPTACPGNAAEQALPTHLLTAERCPSACPVPHNTRFQGRAAGAPLPTAAKPRPGHGARCAPRHGPQGCSAGRPRAARWHALTRRGG